MRRPARDERWADPVGEVWQILEVATWRTETRRHPETGRLVPAGPKNLAYIQARHPGTGETQRVNPDTLARWRRVDRDPLAGHRTRIAAAVRGGATLFTLPAPDKEPPVRKGELYHLACGRVEVDSVARRIVAGRPAEWQITFTRHLVDRLYFLRSTVPGADPDELVKAPTSGDIEHARIDGNYRTEPEVDGDPLACVPPEWAEVGAVSRSELFTAHRHHARQVKDLREELREARGAGTIARISGQLRRLEGAA